MLGSPRADTARRPGLTVEPLDDRVNPVIVTRPDVYTVQAGQVLVVPVTRGVLSNDVSTTSFGSNISAALIGQAKYVGPNTLPAIPNQPQLNANGSLTFIAPPSSVIPANVTQISFSYRADQSNPTDVGIGTATINIVRNGMRFIAAGADAGGGPRVRIFESGSGVLQYDFFAYETTFTGGVRVAVGDLNNDGIDDIVTVPASGGAVRVKIYDGKDLSLLYDNFVYEPTFLGGAYAAIGDFTGDGQNDIIIGAGEGGGSRVTVLTPNALFFNAFQTPITVADFFAYDPALATGVRVAAGDLDGDGYASIITAPGAGGGPQIRTFDLNNIIGRSVAPAPATLSFFAGQTSDRNGVYVAAGNFNGAGQADIVTSSGAGAGVVQVFDGRNGGLLRQIAVPNQQTQSGGGTAGGPSNLLNQTGGSGSLLAPTTVPNSLAPTAGTGINFSNQTGQISGGVRVATTDYDGDGVDDIVVGAGAGNAPYIQVINSLNQLQLLNLLAFNANFLGGVNVGAN